MALSQPVGGNPYDTLIAELEAQRDRYRAALNEIAAMDPLTAQGIIARVRLDP